MGDGAALLQDVALAASQVIDCDAAGAVRAAVAVLSSDSAFLRSWTEALDALDQAERTARRGDLSECVLRDGGGADGRGVRVDIAVIDLTTSTAPPAAIVSDLREAGVPRLAVVGIAQTCGEVGAALMAGASGYLFSERVRPGAPPVQDVDETLDAAFVASADGTFSRWPLRDLHVLRLVADGRSDDDIAEALGVTPASVARFIDEIGDRLGTFDRARMVLLALRAELIE